MVDSASKGRHAREVAALVNVDEQFYSAIGRFVAEFSMVELYLRHSIAKAINLSVEYLNAIVSHDFAMLCTVAQNVLCRDVDDIRKKHIEQITSKCRRLNEHRVQIVHGSWLIGRDAGTLVHASRQTLQSTVYYQQNAPKIAAHADAAHELGSEVFVLWKK